MSKDNESYKNIGVSEYTKLMEKTIKVSSDTLSLIRTFKKFNPKFNPSGHLLYDIRIDLSVFELPDEWFIVKINGRMFLCDQLEGLKKCFNHLFGIHT